MKPMPPLDRLFFDCKELRRLGFPWSRVWLNQMIEQGRFPAPVEISANRHMWRAADLAAFADSLPPVRRKAGARPNGHDGGLPLRDNQFSERTRKRVRLND